MVYINHYINGDRLCRGDKRSVYYCFNNRDENEHHNYLYQQRFNNRDCNQLGRDNNYLYCHGNGVPL